VRHQKHECCKAEEIGGISRQIEGAPGQDRQGHERGSDNRDVATHEHRVEPDHSAGHHRLGPGADPQPAQRPDDQGGDQRHLRPGEREHVIRARGLEGLRRVLVELRAIPEHHREHESPFGSRQNRLRQPGTQCRSGRGQVATQDPGIGALPLLQEPRRLAVASSNDTSPHALFPAGETQGGPQRHALAVDDRRPLGGAPDLDEDPPIDARALTAKPDLVDIELEAKPTGPRAGITADVTHQLHGLSHIALAL